MKKPSDKNAPASGDVIDGVTVYSFENKRSLTIDVNDSDEYVAFAKHVHDSVAVKGNHAALTTLNIVGDYIDKVSRVDGQTLNTTAGGSSIDSTIKHLNIDIANVDGEYGLVSLTNFDRLETVDATKSTAPTVLYLSEGGFDGRSTSGFLHSIDFGVGGGSASVSTVAAAELDSVASLHDVRVKDIDIDAGVSGISVFGIVQQADINVDASHGQAQVTLTFVEGVEQHNASAHGSLGHGVNIELGTQKAMDSITLLSGSLVNYDEDASASAKSAAIKSNLITVSNFDPSQDYVLYGTPSGNPAAVTTVSNSEVVGVNNISAALDVVSQHTVGIVDVAVFHYRGDTYIFQDGQRGDVPPSVDAADSLIKLIGDYDLADVAAHVVAGQRTPF